MELILTAGLMFVVLSVSTGAREKGITAGIAIGGVVALEALFAGPVSGASMNPARSLGPALVSGRLDSLWIYLTATVAGPALAVPLCWLVRADEPTTPSKMAGLIPCRTSPVGWAASSMTPELMVVIEDATHPREGLRWSLNPPPSEGPSIAPSVRPGFSRTGRCASAPAPVRRREP